MPSIPMPPFGCPVDRTCPVGSNIIEPNIRDGMREMRAKKEEGVCIMASCGTKVCLRCWELEPQEGDGGERYEWQGMVVQEEMRVQSEGDEKREEEKSEVQPFGCASTSS